MLDPPDGLCAGEARSEYPPTSAPFSNLVRGGHSLGGVSFNLVRGGHSLGAVSFNLARRSQFSQWLPVR
jgi:hypothetical protein